MRLQQARAQAFVATGAALPKGGLSAGTGFGTGSDNTRGRDLRCAASRRPTPAGFDHVNEAGGLDTAWELDVLASCAARSRPRIWMHWPPRKPATPFSYSVVANVARAYVELRGFQAQIAVSRRNIEAARRSIQFVQTRFNQGLTNELDVTLAQRQLATFEAGLGPLTGQLQSSRYVIAVLLGQYPETLAGEFATEGPAPRFPARIPVWSADQFVAATCGHPASGI